VQPVTQLGGFRDLAVKVETEGVLAVGYRVTNISVSPPTVTVFSSDPELVAAMPGFVRTMPVNLEGVSDDIEVRLLLDLPEGVTLVGEEQNVQVQVGVAAIETSISLQVLVEVVGIGSEFTAELSPEEVGILLSGPLTVLEDLEPEDIVVVVNLADLGLGSHLVSPEVVTFPDRVVVDAIIPETIEVSISLTPSQTETPEVTPTLSPAP
jgi:YbbR domain-containing protein